METKRMMDELDPTSMLSVTGGDHALADEAPPAALLFPGEPWFQRLADLMNANRARQEHLGCVDCVAGFRVLGEGDAPARTFEVTFEEFEATDVREADPAAPRADFTLEATLATWREMIANIEVGRGRPDHTHTLHSLSHRGTPVRLVSDDPGKSALYLRYNQSLQEFVNASASFRTVYGR